MKTARLLRVASVVAGIQFLAHFLMFLRASPGHGPAEVAVVEAMKSHHFLFGGFSRSYWDFYFGYGLMSALNVLIEAVLFWLLAALARNGARPIRPVLALIAVANVAHAVLCLKFFFLTPVVPDLVLAALLGAAMLAPESRTLLAANAPARSAPGRSGSM